jgi:hypothetical protein
MSAMMMFLFSSCRDYLLSHQEFCWSCEYEINGQKIQWSEYLDNPAYWRNRTPDGTYMALHFGTYNVELFSLYSELSQIRMSIYASIKDLSLFLVDDGSSRFILGKEYCFNEKSRADYMPDGRSLPFEVDILNGHYRFESKYSFWTDTYEITVYFDAVEIIKEVKEWYNGEFTVGDTLRINKGVIVQPSLNKIDYCDIFTKSHSYD